MDTLYHFNYGIWQNPHTRSVWLHKCNVTRKIANINIKKKIKKVTTTQKKTNKEKWGKNHTQSKTKIKQNINKQNKYNLKSIMKSCRVSY